MSCSISAITAKKAMPAQPISSATLRAGGENRSADDACSRTVVDDNYRPSMEWIAVLADQRNARPAFGKAGRLGR